MASYIYEVVDGSDATGDDVLACMMGLIPGLGDAAPTAALTVGLRRDAP